MKKGRGGERRDPHPTRGAISAAFSTSPTEDVRRRPTLPHPPECSTIGAVKLSFRVRNGTGRFLNAMTAVTRRDPTSPQPHTPQGARSVVVSPEPHSGREHTLQTGQMLISHRPLVPVSSTHCCASTSGLSTQSSTGGLPPTKGHGYLILKQASRLDAFSGYPFPT